MSRNQRSDSPSSVTWILPLLVLGLLLASRGCQSPGPGPGPGPKPSQVCLLIVEESQQRTPETAEILVSSELRTWLSQHKHLLRIVDPDAVDSSGNPPSVLDPYLAWRSAEANRSVTLPVSLLVRSDGSVYLGGPLPGSAAAVIDWVRANTADQAEQPRGSR